MRVVQCFHLTGQVSNLLSQILLFLSQALYQCLCVGKLLVLRLDGGIQGSKQTFVHEGAAFLHLHLFYSEECKYCGEFFFHVDTIV